MDAVDLICIGAGAKSAAVVAKVHAVNQVLGLNLSVIVIEQSHIAANWYGNRGLTSGIETLGTRPEKDVVFPYNTPNWIDSYAQESLGSELRKFSWQSYLQDQHLYVTWVDRGCPFPTHRRFAKYLSWVYERSTNGIRYLTDTVKEVSTSGKKWQVTVESGAEPLLSRSIMFTGPGTHRKIPGSKILDATASKAELIQAIPSSDSHIVIIGGGESASSMALILLNHISPDGQITLLAPRRPIARSQTYLDNAYYSQPNDTNWTQLSWGERQRFIRATDRGVISQKALDILSNDDRVNFMLGSIKKVHYNSDLKVFTLLKMESEYMNADLAINCTGFDPFSSIMMLLSDEARQKIERSLESDLTEENFMQSIGYNLSPKNLESPLFVPTLSALAQGPGFANLSCLGELSNRVVHRLAMSRL